MFTFYGHIKSVFLPMSFYGGWLTSSLIFILCCVCLSSMGQAVSFVFTQSCLGEQTSLSGQSGVPDTTINAWLWDLDNDSLFDDASGKVTNFIFAQSGGHTVGLKIEFTNGTSDSTTQTVTIDPLPEVNFHVDNLCAEQAAIYQDASNIASGSIDQYLWDFDNNDTVDNNSGPVVTFTVGPPATYVTKLTCISDLGCSAFATKTTEVFPQPIADFSVSTACIDHPINFSNGTQLIQDSISVYIWDFGDGTQKALSEDAIHTYAGAQNYDVSLVAVSSNQCKDTAFQTIAVHENPTLDLQLNNDTSLYVGDILTATAVHNGSSVFWSSGATSDVVDITQTGTFSVEVTDLNGCSTSKSISASFASVNDISIVNDIVTNNNDGFNDFFVIENVLANQTCKLTIYNRWNDVIYSSNNYQNDWDGSYDGTPLPSGAYYYIIECGSAGKKVGNVNVLR